MLEQDTVIDEEGKVIYLKRTYIVSQAKQTPILRVNEIAKDPATGEKWKEGDSINVVDFQKVADNKPQFQGWTGNLTILKTETDIKPLTGSITDGLEVFTIYV